MLYIKLIGIGYSGREVIQRMQKLEITGFEYWLVDSDLNCINEAFYINNKMLLGDGETTSGNSSYSERLTEIAFTEIERAIEGADVLFIVTGTGGETGTAVSPIIAEIANGLGILSISIVTTPFSFEGHSRRNSATWGLEKLKKVPGLVIEITNDKLLPYIDRRCSLRESFIVCNEIMMESVLCVTKNIVNLCNTTIGIIENARIIKPPKDLAVGIGRSYDLEQAIRNAICSSFCKSHIDHASYILMNISWTKDLRQDQDSAIMMAKKYFNQDTKIIVGFSVNNSDEDITVRILAIF